MDLPRRFSSRARLLRRPGPVPAESAGGCAYALTCARQTEGPSRYPGGTGRRLKESSDAFPGHYSPQQLWRVRGPLLPGLPSGARAYILADKGRRILFLGSGLALLSELSHSSICRQSAMCHSAPADFPQAGLRRRPRASHFSEKNNQQAMSQTPVRAAA
jgi:hypothetical protein